MRAPRIRFAWTPTTSGHADEAAPLPTQQDAARSLGFALALADVLDVIPARVTRGIEESKPK
jgi:hypothetical protein